MSCFVDEISRFDIPVKESVFFTNSKVPEFIVRENQHNPIYNFRKDCNASNSYRNSFPADINNSNSIICIPCDDNIDECVIRHARANDAFVYKIYSV